MKQVVATMAALILMLASPISNATLNLNIKVGKMIGNKIIEINRTISTDYEKEIVISSDKLESIIVLNLKKFTTVMVNGKNISPVQVDMKLVNEMQKTIGRPQTVTSFYNHTANFLVSSTGNLKEEADLDISLKFEEIN